ncbi:rod shape-determining protein MreD [Candidatus Daviesbacteria bacterium]|nr:rod shape-determining protein MreD [Candidatus Daviesbacteria bacterium]
MRALIIILIILSFLQATVLSINLVLMILIARSLITTGKSNLYLAFGFGLLSSFLNLSILGLESFLYLLILQFTQAISKSRFANNSLLIIPLSILAFVLNESVLSLVAGSSITLFPKVIWVAVVSLPVFFLVRLWEERFIIRGNIKLRV